MSLTARLLLIVGATVLVVLALFGMVWFVAGPAQASLRTAPAAATLPATAALTSTAQAATTVAAAATSLPASPLAAPVSPTAAAASPTAAAAATAAITGTAVNTATAAGATTAGATAAGATVELPADVHPSPLVAPKLYTYRVVNVYPHDVGAFTEGLIVRDGYLYESTGREGQSTLRKVELATGKVLENRRLADQYFGEGLTELGGKLYQLTWKNGEGFVYDLATLEPSGSFTYPGEGWGITTDGQRLIVSDGTPALQFWDPATLQRTGGVIVSLLGIPMQQINELEYINGSVYANIWQTNLIVRIDPATGNVTGVIDLSGLLDYAPPGQPGQPYQPDVLNGIAFDEQTGRLFVTGKLWPATFEIELHEVPPPAGPAKLP